MQNEFIFVFFGGLKSMVMGNMGYFGWASLQFNYQLAFEGFQFQAIQFIFKIKWLCKTKKVLSNASHELRT